METPRCRVFGGREFRNDGVKEKGTVTSFALVGLLLLGTISVVSVLSLMFARELAIKEKLNQILRNAEGKIDLWTQVPGSPAYTAAINALIAESEARTIPGGSGGGAISATLLNYAAGTKAWFSFLPPGECATLANGKILCNTHMCSLPSAPKAKARSLCYACSTEDPTAKPRMFNCDAIPSGWEQCSNDEENPQSRSLKPGATARYFSESFCAQATSSDSFLAKVEEFPTEIAAVVETQLFGGLFKVQRKIMVQGYPRVLSQQIVAAQVPTPVCDVWTPANSCPTIPPCGNPALTYQLPITWTCSTPALGCRAPTAPSGLCGPAPGGSLTCPYQLCVTHSCLPATCPPNFVGSTQACHRFENGVDVGLAGNSNCNGGAGCPSACVPVTYSCVGAACPPTYTGTNSVCHRFEGGVDQGVAANNNCNGGAGCPTTCTPPCVAWTPTDTCPPTIPCGTAAAGTRTYSCPSGNCCGPQPPAQAISCDGPVCPASCLYRISTSLITSWDGDFDTANADWLAWRATLNLAWSGDHYAVSTDCGMQPSSTPRQCRWHIGWLPDTARRGLCSAAQCARFVTASYEDSYNCDRCNNCTPRMCEGLGFGHRSYQCVGSMFGCSALSLDYNCGTGGRGNGVRCCTGHWTWGNYTYDPATHVCTPHTGSTAGYTICDLDINYGTGTPISLLLGAKSLEEVGSVAVNFPLSSRKHGKYNDWFASSKTPLLVFDPEHQGKITSAEQLFGSLTFGGKKKGSGKVQEWRDGYEALATLDKDRDGVLMSKELDPLALWFDDDRDGVSDEGEVKLLKDVGITKLFTKGTRMDERDKAIYAEPGFEQDVDGKTIAGNSVDWRAGMYEEVVRESSAERRTRVLAEGEDLGLPELSVADLKAASQSTNPGANITDTWDFELTGWPGSRKPRGILVLAKDEKGNKVLGYSRYNEYYYSPEGEVVVTPVVATLEGESDDAGRIVTFSLAGKNGNDTLTRAAISADGRELVGVSRAKAISREGKAVSVEYNWRATRKNQG